MKKIITIILLALVLTGCQAELGAGDVTHKEFNVGEDKVTIGGVGVDGLLGAGEKFKPEAKLDRWNGEESLEVYVEDLVEDNASNVGNKVVSKSLDGKKEFHFYTVDDGFEYELILKEMPDHNVFTWKMRQWEDLDFFYQPALTQAEIDKGNERPENIIGSYAVYHKEKQDHIVGKTNYQTGKLFHIYRPKITDNDGKWIWGELNVTGGTLIIEVDRDWLDNAVYPVSVDPTFGYTTIGGSSAALAFEHISVCKFTLSENGYVSKITKYLGGWSGSSNHKAVIYDDNSGPDALQGVGSETLLPAASQWNDLTFASTVFLNSGDYWIGYANETTARISYDAGSTDQERRDGDAGVYGSVPNPWGGAVGVDNKVSIYATYTTEEPTDSCTPPATGDWYISDDCWLSTDTYIDAQIVLIDAGKLQCTSEAPTIVAEKIINRSSATPQFTNCDLLIRELN